MSKAIAGAVEMAAAAATFAVAPYLAPALAEAILSSTGASIISGIGLTGLGMEVGALADLFKQGPGVTVETRQSAAVQRVVYGETIISPTMIFESTSGGTHGQLNRVHVWCSHQIEHIPAIYLDGRQMIFDGALGSNWGHCDGNNHTDFSGGTYNFGGGTRTYAEHRYGYPGQLVRDKSGSLAPTNYISGLTANDPKWGSNHNVFGHAYSYIKCTFDPALYSGPPQAKAVIRGKNNILDPRTGLRGYTKNAALVIADYLTSGRLGDVVRWGCRFSWDSIDIDELIASANVCDEYVATANGIGEMRYAINGTFTVDQAPGDVLQAMLDACAGALVWSGGKWKIIAGYDRGASIQFDESDITGGIQYSSKVGYRDLFNEVSGTFVAPRYPYNTYGTGYQNTDVVPGGFDGMWAVANFPPFSLSNNRAYPQYPLFDEDGSAVMQADGVTQQLADAFMVEDCERLTTEMRLQFVTSVSQAQRLAKIRLMRHRMQGTATIPLKLCGLRASALDNVLISFPASGWIDKEFEVQTWTLVPKDVNSAPLIETEIVVKETDPASIYYWTTSDELAMNASDYPAVLSASQLGLPTNLVLESGADTAIKTSDGIVRPRIRLTWTPPDDALVTLGGYIAVQYSDDGGATWHVGPLTYGDASEQFIPNVVQAHPYFVRICSVSSRGAKSAWAVAGPHIVSEIQSVITTEALNPNAPSNVGDTSLIDSVVESGAATIRVYDRLGADGSAWTFYRGSTATSVPSAHFTGKAFNTQYFICYDVTNDVTVCLTNFLDTLRDEYYYVGAVVTCTADYVPGGPGGGTMGGGGKRGNTWYTYNDPPLEP